MMRVSITVAVPIPISLLRITSGTRFVRTTSRPNSTNAKEIGSQSRCASTRAVMIGAILGPTLLVALNFMLLVVGVPPWMLIDIFFRRAMDFASNGLSKATWIGLTIGHAASAFSIHLAALVTVGFCLSCNASSVLARGT